jgi:hypothetical protein
MFQKLTIGRTPPGRAASTRERHRPAGETAGDRGQILPNPKSKVWLTVWEKDICESNSHIYIYLSSISTINGQRTWLTLTLMINMAYYQ